MSSPVAEAAQPRPRRRSVTRNLAVEYRETQSLVPAAANPRTHSARQVDQLAASIERFGWTNPVLLDDAGNVVAGHGRLLAAEKLGMAEVPTISLGKMSEAQRRAYLIADNKLAINAGWDDDLLRLELAALKALEIPLDVLGFGDREVAGLLRDASGKDPDKVPEPPKVPITKPGDLWLLGDHRLLCGDSTKPETLARLMDGQQASLLATDPPYLVDYTGDKRPLDKGKRVDKAWDEYVDPVASVAFFSDYLRVALPYLRKNGGVYQWHGDLRQDVVMQAWRDVGLLVHQMIIWAKPGGVLTHSDLLWRHESCLYGWVTGARPGKGRRPPKTATTVWEVSRQGALNIHPTQKPVELFEWPIEWHTEPGDIVLEPFSGSGTQIVAAERLGRRCFAVELAPQYVDVAIERWENYTGKKATKAR